VTQRSRRVLSRICSARTITNPLILPTESVKSRSGRTKIPASVSAAREKRPTSRTPARGAIRSTACASRPATVPASGAPVGAGGGGQTPAAIVTPPVPAPTGLPRAATPAGGVQPTVTPTAPGQAVPALARRPPERAPPQRSVTPGRPAAESPAAVACRQAHRCSRLATKAAGRAATLPQHEPGREVPRRRMDQPGAAPSAKDRSAVTPRRPASRHRCTRQASSRPGTPAWTAAQGRDPSQARRTGASRTAASPAGQAVTSASPTKRGSRQHSRGRLAHGITRTFPIPILAIQCSRSATRLRTSPRHRPGMPSPTAGRPGPGQLPRRPAPALAASLAARDQHPDGTAPRPAPLSRTQPARIQQARSHQALA
jgi:hypothetical protein